MYLLTEATVRSRKDLKILSGNGAESFGREPNFEILGNEEIRAHNGLQSGKVQRFLLTCELLAATYKQEKAIAAGLSSGPIQVHPAA